MILWSDWEENQHLQMQEPETVECLLWVEDEFKDLLDLFMNEGEMESEIDKQTGAMCAPLMQH